MNVFGSVLHLVTFILIFLELFIFVFKLSFFVLRPNEYYRLWFLILLVLLILHNLANGFYPDPAFDMSLVLQNMLKYGSGFLTAAYFPFYFYKTYNLKLLRFHAFYGAPLFLLLPYLIFFVVIYAIRNDLEFAISYGFIIPFFYGAALLLAIPKAIRVAYKTSRNREEYVKGMTVFAGLSPWFALIILDYFHASHLLELLLANLGIIVITTMLLWKSIRRMRREHLAQQGFRTTVFEEKCRFYKLTPKEMEIALFLAEGLTYKEIGERLFISDKTVDNYVQRIYEKVGVRNKMALINKLTK